LVAESDTALHVFENGVWLSTPQDGLAFAELRDERFVRDEALARGVERCDGWNRLAIRESHRGELWLLDDFHAWSSCPPAARLYRRKNQRWTVEGPIRAHWLALGPWLGTSTLIAEVPLRSGPPWGYTLRTVSGGRAPTPKRPVRHVDGGCWTHLEWPLALFSSASGEALVIGVSRCKAPGSDAQEGEETPFEAGIAERFRPGKPSTLEALPVSLDSSSVVIGYGPHAVWTLGKDAGDRAALVANHGSGFSVEEHVDSELALLAVDPNGSLWASKRDELLRRDAVGAWTAVPLPEAAGRVFGVTAVSRDDVWLVTENGVYRSRAMKPYSETARECTDAERARF